MKSRVLRLAKTLLPPTSPTGKEKDMKTQERVMDWIRYFIRRTGDQDPYFGVDPGKKRIYFLGISINKRNPGPTKSIKV